MTESISVLLVDDHTMVREGVRAFLEKRRPSWQELRE